MDKKKPLTRAKPNWGNHLYKSALRQGTLPNLQEQVEGEHKLGN